MSRTELPHVWHPSPNFNARRGQGGVSILVLHYTGMTSAMAARDLLCDPKTEVSSHYLIDSDGAITQMVEESQRAWHAGVSIWHGETDINSRSIGIEIQNFGHEHGYHDFPVGQMEVVAALCRDICSRHPVSARNILAHSDVAPGRKVDPGERFDWKYLHEKGVGHWLAPEPISGGSFLQEGDSGDPVLAFKHMLKTYGYGIQMTPEFDAQTKAVVAAFQRHFRQARVDGVADASTVTTLHKLLRAHTA